MTTNTSQNRTWWIVGCLAAILLTGAICCLVSLITGGGIVAFLMPAVQATGTALAQEMYPTQPRVTDLAPALPPPPGPTATPPAATNFTNNEGRSDYSSAAVDMQGNLHIIWFDNSLREAS